MFNETVDFVVSSFPLFLSLLQLIVSAADIFSTDLSIMMSAVRRPGKNWDPGSQETFLYQ